MAVYGESRLPFPQRRELLLQRIETTLQVREDIGTFENFVSRPMYILAVAKTLETLGELLHPDTGHASPTLSEDFREIRNDLAHEYADVSLPNMWAMLGKVDQLKEEVLERPEGPEAPAAASSGGFSR